MSSRTQTLKMGTGSAYVAALVGSLVPGKLEGTSGRGKALVVVSDGFWLFPASWALFSQSILVFLCRDAMNLWEGSFRFCCGTQAFATWVCLRVPRFPQMHRVTSGSCGGFGFPLPCSPLSLNSLPPLASCDCPLPSVPHTSCHHTSCLHSRNSK